MSKLQKLLHSDLTTQEEDKILEEALEYKLDSELRQRWEKQLKEDYGISRAVDNTEAKIKWLPRIIKVVGAAACILLLFFLFQPVQNSFEQTQELAFSYVSDATISDPRSLKGPESADESRRLAIEAFNGKRFDQVLALYRSIEDKTVEDLYYRALAHLVLEDYSTSTKQFKALSENPGYYRQEINWYLAVSSILSGQKEQATQALLSIHEEDWNYDKAQKLLETMDSL